MLEQAFEVATEFNFDVGQAVLNTNALTGAVQNLSDTSTGALTHLNYLASGLVAHLGLGSGGILAIMSKAVQITEDWDASSLGLANNIMQNFDKLTGTIDTFNDRLGTSRMLMEKISGVAVSNGLDVHELAALTTKIASPLAQKGKLGSNYSGAINMSRNLLLTAENTQVNPMVASESLYMALTGQGMMHGKLFQRLMNTPSFQQAHIMNQAQFGRMGSDKKIDLLSRALQSLASDADALAFRLRSIHTQFVILKDNLVTILKPIGDALKGALVKIMAALNGYLQTNGKKIGDAIGKILGSVLDDPKGLLINLLQIKALGKDVKKAFHIVELIQLFAGLKWALGLLGVELRGGLLMTGIRYLASALGTLFSLVPWGALGAGIMWVARGLAAVAGQFLALTFFLQILSRARAIAAVNDAEAFAGLLPKFSEAFLKLKNGLSNIFHPFAMAIDFWAKLIAPLFEWNIYASAALSILGVLGDLFEYLGQKMILAEATISGFINTLIYLFDDLTHFKNPLAHMREHFNEGIDSYLERNRARLGADGTKATYHVENNNHIEARFDFREQMEPDRIAFAVTDHLMKLATNPRQSRGNSLRDVFARPNMAGANP